MKISVIIPVYNQQQNIQSCLKSIFNQTLKPLEVIVIDDGSIDGTVEKVNHLKAALPNIKLLTQPHLGPAIARNLGAKMAQAEVLVFVDSDMEFDQNFLKQLTLPIITKKAKGSWSGNEWVKNWDNLWARCWNYNQNRRTAKMVGDSQGQRKVFRAILKSEFDKVKGFDNIGYTDDWTLGNKLEYQPKITTAKFYHYNPSSLIEVFNKARWIGKRQYKLGALGTLFTIFRANAGFSVAIGLVKSLIFFTPAFLVFKLVYDLGIMLGAITSLSGKKY